MTTKALLAKLVDRQDLTRAEAESLMVSMMSGDISPTRLAAILTALRVKGESVDEITGFVSAMRARSVHVLPRRNGVIDTCGTGGDAQHTFNISTATALVAAGMGVPVAKHGNRAVSSSCGSADVLEALQISVDIEPEAVAQLIDGVGIGFLFAPHHHPAMKHVAPVRRDLGIRTVFNLLGPLANPAGVKRQLIGVFREDLTEVVAKVLRSLGSEKVFVVHGRDGTDEVSLSGDTTVSLLENGHVHTMTFTPEDAELERADITELSGGDAAENAGHIRDILGGKKGPRRDVVVLNAAFVAVLTDKARNLVQGAAIAQETIDSGRALRVLDELRRVTDALRNGRRG
ncbi:MAG: anthranilate phosphoribosyltransferase [Candidatus Krumholzibacteria bacterium]|nr:anthranilate phosphoribosyltransferase [Candidatus Krumholzibacteria bacterium]